jgi:hypothetical protein
MKKATAELKLLVADRGSHLTDILGVGRSLLLEY